MTPCEFLIDCGFYRKFGHKTSRTWELIFSSYCRGELILHCRRWKAYRRREEVSGDDIMPCGGEVPEPFTHLP